MSRKPKFDPVRFLYSLARTANDLRVLASGDPKRMSRRIRNKMIGRSLRKLWRL